MSTGMGRQVIWPVFDESQDSYFYAYKQVLRNI